jgi:hypothetical protein
MKSVTSWEHKDAASRRTIGLLILKQRAAASRGLGRTHIGLRANSPNLDFWLLSEET